jgi:hypothetical protein
MIEAATARWVAAAGTGVVWNASQNRRELGLDCSLRVCAGRLRDDEFDAVAVDAAAGEYLVASIVVTAQLAIALVVGWQPELRAGLERRPAVDPRFAQWRRTG